MNNYLPNLKKIFLIILINLFFFTFIIFILEYMSKNVIPYNTTLEESSYWYEFRENSDAYINANYNHRKLIRDSFKIKAKKNDLIKDTNCPHCVIFHKYYEDLKTKYINIVSNNRVTKSYFQQPQNSIHLFGASTILSLEVPDDQTISSFLSKKLFDNNYQYQVINYGISGIQIHDQIKRLKYVDFKKNDIIIFYDGGNEIYNKIFRQVNSNTNIIEVDITRFNNYNYYTRLFIRIDTFLISHSFFYRRFLSTKKPLPIKKIEFNENLIKDLQEYYITNLLLLKNFSKSNELKYIHFFQPTIFSKDNNTEYEKIILENEFITPRNMEESFIYAYKDFHILSKKLKEINVNTHDISSVLNNLDKEVYLDYIHVNELANEKISSEIYTYVMTILQK